MADTVKTTKELKFESMFVDGDTRTFSVKNPKSNITNADIVELNNYIGTNQILVGDKYGGRFGRITQASVVDKTTVTLDLEDA